MANVPSSPILATLVNKALSSSETSVLTGTTRLNIPEDGVLHSHCRETSNRIYTRISRIPQMCGVVVWLITLRGFGLDIGFIHYEDYNCSILQLLANATTTHNWIQSEWSHSTYCWNSSKHWLPPSIIHFEHCTLLISNTHSRTNSLWIQRLTDCCVLPSPYNIWLSQWKHWLCYRWLP
jgi:hypothetical protein